MELTLLNEIWPGEKKSDGQPSNYMKSVEKKNDQASIEFSEKEFTNVKDQISYSELFKSEI